jgi:hypothetical protein
VPWFGWLLAINPLRSQCYQHKYPPLFLPFTIYFFHINTNASKCKTHPDFKSFRMWKKCFLAKRKYDMTVNSKHQSNPTRVYWEHDNSYKFRFVHIKQRDWSHQRNSISNRHSKRLQGVQTYAGETFILHRTHKSHRRKNELRTSAVGRLTSDGGSSTFRRLAHTTAQATLTASQVSQADRQTHSCPRNKKHIPYALPFTRTAATFCWGTCEHHRRTNLTVNVN